MEGREKLSKEQKAAFADTLFRKSMRQIDQDTEEAKLMKRVIQERMMSQVRTFTDKNSNQEIDDLSDEDMFDMGQYNLDKETILQPNAKLRNLFGMKG